MKRPALAATFLAFSIAALAIEDAPVESLEAPYPATGEIQRLDPALDALLDPDAQIELLASGFDWSEGPVWDFRADRLYFSDIPRNTVFQWKEGAGVSIFLSPSGYTGSSYEGREPGSNGLGFDLQGRLVLCQHGDRRVARLVADRWGYETIVDSFEGQRLRSPNDLCFDEQGNLFFTDPPYGMPAREQKQIDASSVYRVSNDGTLAQLPIDLKRPNGIGISPDQRTLYVTSTSPEEPYIMRYALAEDGSVSGGEIFFDASKYRSSARPGLCDGLAVDRQGNVWTSGPGGVYVLSQNGTPLGAILVGRTANCAFGGADGKTLYITADDKLCRIRTRALGYFPNGANAP